MRAGVEKGRGLGGKLAPAWSWKKADGSGGVDATTAAAAQGQGCRCSTRGSGAASAPHSMLSDLNCCVVACMSSELAESTLLRLPLPFLPSDGCLHGEPFQAGEGSMCEQQDSTALPWPPPPRRHSSVARLATDAAGGLPQQEPASAAAEEVPISMPPPCNRHTTGSAHD